MIIRTQIFFFFFSSSPSFLFHNRFPLFIAGFLSFSTDSDWWMTAHFVVVVAKLLLRLFIRSFSFAHIARLFRRSLVRLPDLLVPTFTRHGNERFLSYCAGQCQCQMHFTSLSPALYGTSLSPHRLNHQTKNIKKLRFFVVVAIVSRLFCVFCV